MRPIVLIAVSITLVSCVTFETARPCRPEANAHLAAMGLPQSQVLDTTLRDDQIGGRGTTRITGSSLWVRLKSCRGHLVLDMDRSCRLIHSYTTGECARPGG
jgi:hypothetical protein